jgi:hypothetical protein
MSASVYAGAATNLLPHPPARIAPHEAHASRLDAPGRRDGDLLAIPELHFATQSVTRCQDLQALINAHLRAQSFSFISVATSWSSAGGLGTAAQDRQGRAAAGRSGQHRAGGPGRLHRRLACKPAGGTPAGPGRWHQVCKWCSIFHVDARGVEFVPKASRTALTGMLVDVLPGRPAELMVSCNLSCQDNSLFCTPQEGPLGCTAHPHSPQHPAACAAVCPSQHALLTHFQCHQHIRHILAAAARHGWCLKRS